MAPGGLSLTQPRPKRADLDIWEIEFLPYFSIPQEAHCCSVKLVSRHLFSFSCQISDPVLVLPQKGADPLQHSHPVFSEWLPTVSVAFSTFQWLSHGLEEPPGSCQRVVPTCESQPWGWSTTGLPGRLIKGPVITFTHIPCVPVGFG